MPFPPRLPAVYLALVATAMLGSNAAAQPRADATRFVGQWQGTLHTPGPALRLDLTIRPDTTGVLTGVLRSVDQGNAETLATFAVRGDSVFVEMPLIEASFTAVLSPGRDSLRGTFKQVEGSLPLVMLRQSSAVPNAGALRTQEAPVARGIAERVVDASAHRSTVMMARGIRVHALDWGGHITQSEPRGCAA
jgi:hypothetical protein